MTRSLAFTATGWRTFLLRNSFNRRKLEASIEVMLALLDIADGDADEQDGIVAERCECGDDDLNVDQSWTEWHTRGRHKLAGGLSEMPPGGLFGTTAEDAEDDDPSDDDGEDCEHDGREPDDGF